MSRRSLLAVASAATAMLLAGCEAQRRLVDVRAFGAKGDGVADDAQAINAAVAALRSNSTLYFPRGVYRFAQRWPPGTAAVVIAGMSDVSVEFDAGAELWMDNLDPVTRLGTGHGILVRGPASRIMLRNVNIRWTAGAKRSLGDGIRVQGCPGFGTTPPTGWPGRRAPVDGITVTDCVVRQSPQTGMVVLGASNISMTGLRVFDSGADGLHFNACRRARIDDVAAVGTGDDGLALVTYFAPAFAFDSTAGTFSLPALTDWSNAEFNITNVSVGGGRANGVRISGANQVTIGGVKVVGVQSGSAIMLDSAEPGSDVGWDYVASRGVRIEDVTATNCNEGLHLVARPGAAGDRQFTEFDVHISAARFDTCRNWSVRAESLADPAASGLRMDTCTIDSASTTGGNGGVGLNRVRGISFGDLSIRHAQPAVALSAEHTDQLTVGRLSIAIDSSAPPAATPAACLTLVDADGVIDDLDVSWPAAPAEWAAVRMSDSGRCGHDDSPGAMSIKTMTATVPVERITVECS